MEISISIFNDAISKLKLGCDSLEIYYYPDDESFHFDILPYGTFLIGPDGPSNSNIHIQYKNTQLGIDIWKII